MNEDWKKEWDARDAYMKRLGESFPDLLTNESVFKISSVPKGWEDLVWNLCECIDNHVKSYRYKDGEKVYNNPVSVAQIKSKFAGLRFYINGGDDTVRGMIDLAEHMSFKICEFTGKLGSRYKKGGWVYTLCDEKAEELGATKVKN